MCCWTMKILCFLSMIRLLKLRINPLVGLRRNSLIVWLLSTNNMLSNLSKSESKRGIMSSGWRWRIYVFAIFNMTNSPCFNPKYHYWNRLILNYQGVNSSSLYLFNPTSNKFNRKSHSLLSNHIEFLNMNKDNRNTYLNIWISLPFSNRPS